MRKIAFSTAFLGLTCLVAMFGGPLPGAAQERPNAPRGADLIDALRQGGYVIYFRHALSNPDQVDADTAQLGPCGTQRNLSSEGRRMARDIGKALQTLRIPVAKIYTSPYCRAVDTAELAFGRHENSNDLYFAVGLSKEERERQSVMLRQMLSTAPKAGSNTVIVSHHANLKEAAGIWPKREGDAHVFRPRPGGGFDHVGEIAADEWSRRAASLSPALRPDGRS
jgi:phosphohistidine phosphatase SixA